MGRPCSHKPQGQQHANKGRRVSHLQNFDVLRGDGCQHGGILGNTEPVDIDGESNPGQGNLGASVPGADQPPPVNLEPDFSSQWKRDIIL